jgi:hypothetical protein
MIGMLSMEMFSSFFFGAISPVANAEHIRFAAKM